MLIYVKKIKILGDKMCWENNDFLDIFGKKFVDKIIRFIKLVLSGDLVDVDILFLVGGLLECDYVKWVVKSYFV